jgi:hypothetical protein
MASEHMMLHDMCHDALTNADVNAIRRARGFSQEETRTRDLLENFFLSSTGVKDAMESLTYEEIVTLRLLHFQNEEVKIEFFTRLYPDAVGERYGTYHQKYNGVFKKVRERLIRSGVLIYHEEKGFNDTGSKMERYRFRFPRRFAHYLPLPFKETVRLEQDGRRKPDGFRQNLVDLLNTKQTRAQRGQREFEIALSGGSLVIGGRPFRVGHLREWQRVGWKAAVQEVTDTPQGYRFSRRWTAGSPVPFLYHVFHLLELDMWVPASAVRPLLEVFYAHNEHPSTETILEMGWKWGCLMQTRSGGHIYYRPVEVMTSGDPAEYAEAEAGRALIDVEQVPYTALEVLNQIANLETAGDKLAAVPDLPKLGEAPEEVRHHPLTRWLGEHCEVFQEALEAVAERWGKLIVHDRLLLARVTDLSLRVELERALADWKNDVVFLDSEWMAFPDRLLKEVHKVLRGAGHVMKVEQA